MLAVALKINPLVWDLIMIIGKKLGSILIRMSIQI
jgi:hypothetical protein